MRAGARLDDLLDQVCAELNRPDPEADRRRALQTTITQLDRELANLTTAVASGGDLPQLLAALQDRQTRRDEAAADLARVADRPSLRIDRTILRRTLETTLTDWRSMLVDDPAAARRLLVTVLDGRITFTPGTNQYGGIGFDVTIPLRLDRIFEASIPAVGTVLSGGQFPKRVASPTGEGETYWDVGLVGHTRDVA